MVSADTQLILNTVNNGVSQTINTILSRLASNQSQLIGVINTGNNILLNNTNALLTSATSQIVTRLASYNAQQISLQQSIAQQIIGQIQNSNSIAASLEQQTQTRLLQSINALGTETIGVIQSVNTRILETIKGVNAQTNAIVRDTGDRVVNKVLDVQNDINTGGGGLDLTQLLNGDFLNNLITEVLNVLFDIDISHQQTHSGIIEDALQPFVDSVHSQAEKIRAIFDNVNAGKYNSLSDLLNAFYDVGVNHTLLDIAIFASQAVPSVLRIGSIITAPFFTRLEQAARAQYGFTLLDASTLLSLWRKHWIQDIELNTKLKQLGYNDDNIQLLKEASFSVPTLESLRALYFRGALPLDKVKEILNNVPISNEDRQAFIITLNQVPGMADLVSMAVREAFSPDIANRFGQFEDYPTELTPYARNNGFTEEWAKRYWAAHWNLPSPQQGFDMYHRGLINDSDLTLLLKALDVMPYWRDKLKGITYALPTRVDIRRMYSENIINYQDVLRAYKDLGYDNTWAKRLADFAVRYDEEQDAAKQGHIRDLTYGTIETAYKRKIIDRNEAVAKLQALKYVSKDINILLSLWDYQEYVRLHPDRSADEYNKLADITLAAYKRKVLDQNEAITFLVQSGYNKEQATKALAVADIEYQVAVKADIVNAISKQYYEGMVDERGVQQRLVALGFNTSEISILIDNLVIMRSLQINRPTKAELVSMAKKGIISVDDLRNEFRNMNYAEQWIEPLIALAGLGEET